MRESIRSIIWIAGIIGALLMWLATHSIPEQLETADGFLATNLKWLGWADPPTAVASKAADNRVLVLGTLLLASAVVGLGTILVQRWRGRANVLVQRLEKVAGVPDQHNTAIRIVIKNRGTKRLEGLVAQLTQTDPALLGFPAQVNLPLTLATKSRLDALRNHAQPLPHMPFSLNPGAEKHIEIFWLHSAGALEGHITHEAGDAEFLIYPGYVFHVEVSGESAPAKCRVRLLIVNDETGQWDCELLR